MSAAGKAPTILYADQEHSGLRLAIFIAMFIGYLAGFVTVSLLLGAFASPDIADYSLFLSCVGGVPFALVIIWGLEKILKRVWHSGLSLTLDDRGLFVNDRRANSKTDESEAPAMVWSAHLNQINWYFRLKGYPRGGRERRVPSKWLGVATEVQQDDARLNVYALMPPEAAAVWTENHKLKFHYLNVAELYDSTMRAKIGPPSRPTIDNHLLQSRDGRYWLAERRRWEYGIELTPDDFATLMRYVTDAQQAEATLSNN